jgi:putative ABC transport system permease protein
VRAVRSLRAIFRLAAQRVWSNLGLMAGTALGLVVAVALATSVPMYVDGVNERVLQRALVAPDTGRARPPFAFLYRYLGDSNGPLAWADAGRAEQFFAERLPGMIGLSQEVAATFVRTAKGRLYPGEASDYDQRAQMDWLDVGTIHDLQKHIELVDGRLPSVPAAGDVIDVLMAEDKANEFGVLAGEQFLLIIGPENKPFRLKLRVAGIWRAVDATEDFWFYDPGSLNSTLLVDENVFADAIVPQIGPKPVEQALWYQVYDGSRLHAADALGYLGRWLYAGTEAGTVLPGVSLDLSPLDAVNAFAWTSRLLTILLYVFTLPIAAIIIGFISINSMLVVQRQRNEIAVLRSRGTTAPQIGGLYLLEGLILSIVALAAGPWLGRLMAQAMAHTQSFLSFGAGPASPIEITRQSLLIGAAAAGIATLAGVLPALGAARHTIVTYKQDLVRSLRRPWWQAVYLDLWLLAVPAYGYYELKQRGTISFLGKDLVTAAGDPFSNPLLFLVPTLFVFALAVFFLRLFPWLMRALAALVQPLPDAAPLLALRQLERQWKHYTGPLFLIMLTLGLACFTASMAKTLDLALTDRTYYTIGADLHVVEMGDTSELPGSSAPAAGGAATQAATGQPADQMSEDSGGYWSFLPVSEHTKVPGVLDATRVAGFEAVAKLGDQQIDGMVLGVDRLDFARVVPFRADYAGRAAGGGDAGQSLGALMNRLARQDGAVLVTTSFMRSQGLKIGDPLSLQVTAGTESHDVPAVVAGAVDYFPLLYPDDGPFFVANLDYLFERFGGERPYDVMLRTAPGSKTADIRSGLDDLGLSVISVDDARAAIDKERLRPERQGLLGLLSVGFLASAALTVLGFLFYAFLSFRQRFIQLGMLRALGLSMVQMIGFLGLEQLVLIVTGVAAGTGAGVLASKLFIPFLQVQSGAHPQVPPFRVLVAWDEIFRVYAIFGAMLLVAIAGLAWFLVRLRIAEAVKLGETA